MDQSGELNGGKLEWRQVSEHWVASWSCVLDPKSKKKRSEIEGYEDHLAEKDVPEEILQVKEAHGWYNFARLACTGEMIYIAGDNVATRRRVARAVLEWYDNQGEGEGEVKDGAIQVFFNDRSSWTVLHIRASQYAKGGADPEAILEEISQYIDRESAHESERRKEDFLINHFMADVCLDNIWWSHGTPEKKRESSEKCLKVLSGLFEKLGCQGLIGDLILNYNDLDDQFLQEFLGLVGGSCCCLNSVKLDHNRITTAGAKDLLERIQSGTGPCLRYLSLKSNPIDNHTEVLEAAEAAGVQCDLGPAWTEEEAKKALKDTETWNSYFYGPAQLLRAKMLEDADARQLPMVECPICDIVLKHDFSNNPSYTITGNLAFHLCGKQHRGKLNELLKSNPMTLPKILVVSDSCNFFLHPLTGDLACVKKRDDSHVEVPGADQQHYVDYVEVLPAASSLLASGQEGRESLAMDPRQEVYDYLMHCHNDAEFHRWHDGKRTQDPQYTEMYLNVSDLEYTQRGIKDEFGGGMDKGHSLHDLIDDLDEGRVDPCRDLRLDEVVPFQGRYYSLNNRRLYCLKQHQQNVDWNVQVKCHVRELETHARRFVERMLQRQLEGHPRDYIQLRHGRRW